MNRGRPIRPEEVPEAKAKIIPPFVFDAVNELLVKREGKVIRLRISEVSDAVKKAMPEGERYQSWWLDFESCYADAGWRCVYDGPAYCESYEGFYTFEKKK